LILLYLILHSVQPFNLESEQYPTLSQTKEHYLYKSTNLITEQYPTLLKNKEHYPLKYQLNNILLF